MRRLPAFRLSPDDSARLHEALGDVGPAPRRWHRPLLAIALIAAFAAAGTALWHL